jgi:hypothetical protein
MKLDTQKFNTTVEAAKAKAASDPKWLRAIEKAAAMMASGELVVTLFADNTALVTSPRNSYRVNGHCHCRAAQNGHTQCVHRCAKRIAELMDVPDTFTADVAASSRKNLIIEIKNVWPKIWPPMAVELMARFKVNRLEYLDDDSLRRVRLAIAL